MDEEEYVFPTEQEFTSRVINDCLISFPVAAKNGLQEYLDSEEAKEVIRLRYKSYKEHYEAGELTPEQVEVGAIASVSNCLFLMAD